MCFTSLAHNARRDAATRVYSPIGIRRRAVISHRIVSHRAPAKTRAATLHIVGRRYNSRRVHFSRRPEASALPRSSSCVSATAPTSFLVLPPSSRVPIVPLLHGQSTPTFPIHPDTVGHLAPISFYVFVHNALCTVCLHQWQRRCTGRTLPRTSPPRRALSPSPRGRWTLRSSTSDDHMSARGWHRSAW